MELLQQSLFIPCGAHQLHVRHIKPRVAVHGEPILMVHGAIENGRIFYTESGKGLACFLARHGYQVYVADLRGGGSALRPSPSRRSTVSTNLSPRIYPPCTAGLPRAITASRCTG